MSRANTVNCLLEMGCACLRVHITYRGGEGRGLASLGSTRLVVDRCTHRFPVVCQHCVEGRAELGVGGGL